MDFTSGFVVEEFRQLRRLCYFHFHHPVAEKSPSHYYSASEWQEDGHPQNWRSTLWSKQMGTSIDWKQQIQLQLTRHIYLNQWGFILHGFESLPIKFVDRSFCDEYSSFTRLEALIVLAYSRSKQDLLDPIFSFQCDQSRRGVQLIPYVISLPSTIQPVTRTLPLQCVRSSNLSSKTAIMLLNV